MTHATANHRRAAYAHAREVANQSGHTPGLDDWWAVLKAEEKAELLRLSNEEQATQEEPEEREGTGWAAYTQNYYGHKRWSVAHVFVDSARVPLCGTDPGNHVEWAAEEDAFYPARCSCCERLLNQEGGR